MKITKYKKKTVISLGNRKIVLEQQNEDWKVTSIHSNEVVKELIVSDKSLSALLEAYKTAKGEGK
ncbi:MAG: hypothetical protein UR73_C0038G0004 [candidate division WS6 bacterium GW2011_GWF1_35_23]|uniref:Uncharacterized protein n=1 Tax=candidate division WS6 bacterium GW2011_GWF1_35_23 TaxID=1619097 RepID=A0A0G0CEQ1_9BACT|nr:MAG: hypothetical protein UR73_C0038G0004 [candidate division WS6 bacterium GW2011_GWF1_35_23]KKQ29788.1 MAG: hypothetical protein US46_C0017G0004 [Candidatus Shapirobacteria bacterium GW2011_GWF2_37_20]